MTGSIDVLLADDQTLVRGAFALLVASTPDMTVAGEAGTGEEAVELARSTRPDVVIMDIRMPDLDGIEACRQIVEDENLDGVRVLMLTTFETDDNVVQAIRAGASGFLVKDTLPEDLIEAIRTVAAGDALLSPGATRALIARVVTQREQHAPDAEQLAELTQREHEVLTLVASGLSNQEIADELVVSPLTAKTHISRILAKLELRDRAQLVIAAYESGLVSPGG